MVRIATGTSVGTEWARVRDTIDLAEVAVRLFGPAPGRRGERGRKLWWPCPFHEDANPSFAIEPGRPWWRCYGCGAGGDVIDLVRGINSGLSFPEAVAFVTGDLPAPSIGATPRAPSPKVPRDRPRGMDPAEALAIVEAAEARLWTPDGAAALGYLRGRGLADATIRSARLGVVGPLCRPGHPRGIVLAWWDGPAPTLVKIRQPGDRRPKYFELCRDRPALYPGPGAVRPGRALVIVEGEFDAMLLGQELGGLAAVVTLGGASARPTPDLLGRILGAFPWCVATDADAAGDRAADGWPAKIRRVRPPGPFKDWTEAHQGGVDLRRWWGRILEAVEAPPPFTWEQSRELRWGPAVGDPEPGIDAGDAPRLGRAPRGPAASDHHPSDGGIGG